MAYSVARWNPTAKVWEIFGPAGGVVHQDPNFVSILNWVATNGWRVVTAGNFDSMPQDEVILEK
jgi:hypothetical protein